MKKLKWRVTYYIRSKNLYTTKIVWAIDKDEAIRKARVKYIVDLVIIE